MKRRVHKGTHLVWGQVMIEFVLAAVGIVLLGFMSVRVAQWLNATMVARNAEFQTSRAAAGKEHAGVVPYFSAGAPPLHLIRPGAGTTGGNPAEGDGPSTTPPGCTSAEIGLAAAAQAAADDARTKRDALVQEATKLSNDARCVIGVKNGGVSFVNEKGLPDGRSDGGGDLLAATGCYMRSANWYMEIADRVEWLINEITRLTGEIDVLTGQIDALTTQINTVLQPAVDAAQNAVNTAQTNVNAAQTALTNAQNLSCPDIATTRNVCETTGTDCSDRQTCIDGVVSRCNNDWPPGNQRDFCMLGTLNCTQPCVDIQTCHDETTYAPDTVCEGMKAAAILSANSALITAQGILTAAQTALTTAQNALQTAINTRTTLETTRTAKTTERQGRITEKALLCAAAMSGNPLVPSTHPADCTGPDLRDYANNVLNPKAHEWMTRVKDVLGPEIGTLSQTVQDKTDEAKNHRAAARLECASGHDTY